MVYKFGMKKTLLRIYTMLKIISIIEKRFENIDKIWAWFFLLTANPYHEIEPKVIEVLRCSNLPRIEDKVLSIMDNYEETANVSLMTCILSVCDKHNNEYVDIAMEQLTGALEEI